MFLRAELARAHTADAGELYEAAAGAAERDGCIRRAALAHELHARWLDDRGDGERAVAELNAAIRAYRAWAAVARVESLRPRADVAPRAD